MLRLEPMRSVEPIAAAQAGGGLKVLALVGALMATGNAGAQALQIRPSIDTRLTYSDNINASSDNEKSDWVAEIAPSIVMLREEGRFTGRLQATLRNVIHAREGDRDTSFVALDGNGQLEAVRNRLFIDMDAATSRNNTTGLSGRASSDFLSTDSSNETRQFSIGPRLLFRLGDAEGAASHRRTWFDGGGALLQRNVGDSQIGLSDPTAFGRFGWGLSYGRTDTSYDDGLTNDVTEEISRATLYLNVSRKLRLHGVVGYEQNDYSVNEEHGRIAGGGFDWHPSERTLIAASAEDRFFGRSYSLQLNHRRPRSVWDVSWSRDVTSSLDSQSSFFNDPAFRQLYDNPLLELIFPDPVDRFNAVRGSRQEWSGANAHGFVTNNYFVSRTLRGSFSLIGARNVLTFALQRSDNSRLGDPLVTDPRDDFAEFDDVETDSAILSLNHRLTSNASLNATLTRSRSIGHATDEEDETRRTMLSVGVSRRLGAYTNAALAYRYQRADGSSDFTENVLTASLGMQF
ncbi:TIGR03016 family PEP-CTERM system-associated outer membrane protein [Aromatoleum sp.]|uniref:TIGR03016 family PEP-CTERM system-associated outer membrane protein n=1 Tax=Aromatoleum sp. TaxID=2307007 RepID=UPI002FCC0DDF